MALRLVYSISPTVGQEAISHLGSFLRGTVVDELTLTLHTLLPRTLSPGAIV